METSTDINNLPSQSTSPESLSQSENIIINNPLAQQISTRENDINNLTTDISNPQDYNEIISSLQKASKEGQTNLPDRNIPTNSDSIMTDNQINTQYIPPADNSPLLNDVSNEDIYKYNNDKINQENYVENLYQEFQIPILITILYFLFQLPVIQQYIFKIIPALYKTDGNPNIFGYLLNSLLFGLSFYLLLKGLNYFSDIQM